MPCAILLIDLISRMALVICILRQYHQTKDSNSHYIVARRILALPDEAIPCY